MSQLELLTSKTSAIKQRLRERDRFLAQQEGRREQLREQLSDLVQQLEESKADLSVLEQTLGLFQDMEAAWHKSFEERLAALVTRGLSLVFAEKLELVLETRAHGDVTALDFKLVQYPDGHELVTDILDAKGGGVVAVAAFLLRVLIMLAYQPALRPVMILDESFAHLSSEYVPNLARLLQKLNSETGIQFLMVTHDPTFVDYADVAYEASQHSGATKFNRLKTTQEHICE